MYIYIVDKYLNIFKLSEYGSAVLQAFKLFEITVRGLTDFNNEELGVKLLRKAFNTNNGILTNFNQHFAERRDAFAIMLLSIWSI